MEVTALSALSIVDRFLDYIEKYPLSLVESAITLLPLLVGVFFYKKLSKFHKFLWIYCLIYLLYDLPLWALALERKNNYLFVNLQEFTTGLVLIISFFFLNEKIAHKWLMAFIAIAVIIFTLSFKILAYSSPIFVANRLFYIILCFAFFYILLNKLAVNNLLRYPEFISIAGLMIYSCGTLLLYVFSEITVSYNLDGSVYDFFTSMGYVFRILLMLIFALAFFTHKHLKNG